MRPHGLFVLGLLAMSCKKEPEPPPEDTDPAPEQPENNFPMPDDLDEIDFVSAFQEAARLMVSVSAQQPWKGHAASLQARGAGCPDFWTGFFTVGGLEVVGSEDAVSWYDDCLLDSGRFYDGFLTWDFDVQEFGDPNSFDGRISEASRRLEGDAVVGEMLPGQPADLRFEFDGVAEDNFYQVEAYGGYQRFVYSTLMTNATVTGTDVFPEDSLTPGGFRTDLYMFTSGGDVEVFEASGNVYLFEPTIMDRFDSIGVDMVLQGDLGAAPTDCVQEPLGWIGLRDTNAYWYDVVFLPRSREDIVGEEYPNDPLSVCDGCGRLYVQGVEQEGKEVCVDFSFLFDEFPLPDPDEYVLPMHSL